MGVLRYFVVGVYMDTDEVPTKIYKVTNELEVALNCYITHHSDKHCAIGCYFHNRLIDIIKLVDYPADGPGIFKMSVEEITKEDINNFPVD